MSEVNKRFWFAQVPNPKTKEPHWVRVSSAGKLNNSTQSVFKVRQAADWREIEAPTLSDARTALLAGRGKRCNAATLAAAKEAKAKAAKAKKPAAKKATAKKAETKKTVTAKKEPSGGQQAPVTLVKDEPAGVGA